MKHRIASLCLLPLLAACTQKAAPVAFCGDIFYKQDAAYNNTGTELPQYGSNRQACLPQTHARSKSETDSFFNDPSYAVSASVDSIGSSELPPVSAPQLVAPSTNYDAQNDIESQDTVQTDATTSTGLLPLDWLEKTPASQPLLDEPQAPKKLSPSSIQSSELLGTVTQQPQAAAPSFVWPLRGNVITPYEKSTTKGVNISGRKGEPVRASADGVVAYAGNNISSLGNMIVVQHAAGFVSTYAHLSDMMVNVGDEIIQSELIGFVGQSGTVGTPQLHFALRRNNAPINPTTLLK